MLNISAQLSAQTDGPPGGLQVAAVVRAECRVAQGCARLGGKAAQRRHQLLLEALAHRANPLLSHDTELVKALIVEAAVLLGILDCIASAAAAAAVLFLETVAVPGAVFATGAIARRVQVTVGGILSGDAIVAPAQLRHRAGVQAKLFGHALKPANVGTTTAVDVVVKLVLHVRNGVG
jgi:hypothetical protein